MNKDQNVKEDVHHNNLEEFIDDLPKKALPNLKKIVELLIHDYKLLGEATFGMPRKKFRDNQISREYRKHLLKKLHKIGTIHVFANQDVLESVSNSLDSTAREKKEITVLDDPDLVFSSKALITVRPKILSRLHYLLEHYSAKSQTMDEIEKERRKPKFLEKGGLGYIRFTTYGKRVPVGGDDSMPYKYLKFVLRAGYGVSNKIEDIFEAVRDSSKKSHTAIISIVDTYQRMVRINGVLKNSCIKELQKGEKFKDRLKFVSTKNHHRIELIKRN